MRSTSLLLLAAAVIGSASTHALADTILYAEDFEDPAKLTAANFSWLEFRGGNPSVPSLNALGVSTVGNRNLFLNVNTTAATTSWFAGLRHVYDAPLPVTDLSKLSLTARVGGGGTAGPVGDVFLRIESSANNWVGFHVSGEVLAADPNALVATGGLLSQPTATVGSFNPAAERFNIVLAFANTLATWGNDASNVIRLDDVRLVWLADGPSQTYEQWLAERLTAAELEQPERTDPAADPGGFGISNLMRYALDLDPRTPSAAGLPTVGLGPDSGEGSRLRMTFLRRKDAADLVYRALASDNMIDWNQLPAEAVVAVAPIDDRVEQVTVEDVLAGVGSGKRFLRLQVELTGTAP
jgi:hypothetical protein